MKSKKLWAAVTMFGGIVGAGAFGVPFVFSKAGVPVGLLYVAVLAAVSALVNSFYAVVAAESEGRHRLVGYARRNLGKRAAGVVAAINLVEFYGALLAYVILGGGFLASIFGGSEVVWSIAFWVVASLMLFLPLKRTESVDHALSFLIVGVIAAIAVIVWPKIDTANLLVVSPNNWFVPYGVLFFALSGSSVIPEIVEISRRDEKSVIPAIAWGTAAAAAAVAVFGAVVVGVCGQGTAENAIAGLVPYFGKTIVGLGALFGLAAITTQFVIIGANIRDQFIYDFKFRRIFGWLAAVAVPFAAFVAGARDFIGIIGFMGATLGAAVGVIIIVMGLKVISKSGKHRLLRPFAIPIIILFAAGIIAEIISLLR